MKKLSDTQRARLITGLRYAKWQLQTGWGHGICGRLWEAVLRDSITEADFNYLQKWIMGMLNKSTMYEGWMVRTYGRQPTEEQARAARIRWCEWMIKELTK